MAPIDATIRVNTYPTEAHVTVEYRTGLDLVPHELLVIQKIVKTSLIQQTIDEVEELLHDSIPWATVRVEQSEAPRVRFLLPPPPPNTPRINKPVQKISPSPNDIFEPR